MVEIDDLDGAANSAATSPLTTAGATPAGPNPYTFVVAASQSDPTAVDVGGDAATQTGADAGLPATFFYTSNFWEAADSPTGAIDTEVTLSGGASSGSSATTVAHLKGVDLLDPVGDLIENSGQEDAGFTTATITVPDLAPGDFVFAGLAVGCLGPNPIASIVEADANCDVVRADFPGSPGEEREAATAAVVGTSAGTSLVLNVTITLATGTNLISWKFWARKVNAAAVVAAGSAGPLVNGAMIKSKLKGLVQ